jgi:serine/threonine protein kinase/tetratricopeptide (TPR) repeat protein
MGEVYSARDPRLGREVAIKVISESFARDGEAVTRFMREAKAVAALSHPNILSIFDIGTEADMVYAVTELLHGETLHARLAGGSMPWRKAAEIGMAVAEGLAAAHAKNIVHRDLKPANIFLTGDGRVKILDFGLARIEGESVAEDDETRTAEGRVVGSVGYMSPEQVRGEAVGTSSDIFSLGCVLYEAVSGRRAFKAQTSVETLTAILREMPPDLVTMGLDVPIELQRVISHCLEKSPQERFQSARDLAFDLKACVGMVSSRVVSSVNAPIVTNSIAVLPFTALGSEPDGPFLSEGITESIINSLAQVPQLRVTPRSIAFRYKGKDAEPHDVGRELNVRVVLTGRVMLRGQGLIVSTELLHVAESMQLWGERFNCKVEDIFEVEEQVARRIVEKLRVKLTGEVEQRILKRFTENSEAYQFYLKGRHYWTRRNPEAMRQAIEFFEQAIAKDASYALAYAGLSDCYSLFAIYSIAPGREAWSKARATAAAAISFDAELAEGYAAMGFIRAFGDWDWRGAERDMRRACELNPAFWVAPYWYSIVLCAMNRVQDAEIQVRRARELEPLSPVVLHAAAWAAILAGRPEEAIQLCREGLSIDPTFPLLRVWFGLALETLGRYGEAVDEYRQAVRLSPGISWITACLAHACVKAGHPEDAERLLQELLQPPNRQPVDNYALALVHVARGEYDRAIRLLDDWCETRSGFGSVVVYVDPRMSPLRAEPRFLRIVERLGFEGSGSPASGVV